MSFYTKASLLALLGVLFVVEVDRIFPVRTFRQRAFIVLFTFFGIIGLVRIIRGRSRGRLS